MFRYQTPRFLVALLVGLLGVTLMPAQVGASGTADVAVVLTLIDDAGEPQRLRATVTNQGPQGSAHPILEVDAGEGAEVTGHTGDPQPGSLADGVACASRPEGFSCQWADLAAGAQVAVDIELSVAAATTVTARLDAAGTPDHNPEGNNLATLALSPATTDLAVAVVVTLADRTATLAVTVANVAGRRDSAGLGIVPAPAITPAGCNADGARASCPVSALAAGEAVSFEAVIERPSPGAEPSVVSVAAVPSTYQDPRPADNTAEVHIPPREAVAGEVVRLAGSERIATAVAISRAGFADGSAGAAVLARADLFADALAGAPLAVAVGGPLMLTPGAALAEATARSSRGSCLPGGPSTSWAARPRWARPWPRTSPKPASRRCGWRARTATRRPPRSTRRSATRSRSGTPTATRSPTPSSPAPRWPLTEARSS